MRKLFLLVLLVVSVNCFSQFPSRGAIQFPTTNGSGFRGTGGDSLLWIPSDTIQPASSLTGRTHIARKGTTLYYWNGTKYTAISSGGGSTPTFKQVLNAGTSLSATGYYVDSVGSEFSWYGYADPTYRWEGYNPSSQLVSRMTLNSSGWNTKSYDRSTGDNVDVISGPTRFNVTIGHTFGNFYIHNSKETDWMDQAIQNQWNGDGGGSIKSGEFRTVTGVNSSDRFYTTMNNQIGTTLYNRIYLDSANAIQIGTKRSPAATFKGIKVDFDHQFYVDSMATGGSADDSVVVITSTGQQKKRNASAFVGATPTWQQTLTAGSVLSGNNTVTMGANDVLDFQSNGLSGSTSISNITSGTTNSAYANLVGAGIVATNSGGNGQIYVTPTDVIIQPPLGVMHIDTLASGGSVVDSFLVWQNSNSGQVKKLDGNKVVSTTGTQTLSNKRWTPRVGSTTSSATPTINTDDYDIYKLTAQAADITSFTTNLSGTPNDGDILEIQVTGTAARAITWGSSFVSTTVTLPTTTVSTTTLTIVLQYYTTSSYSNNKWHCVNYY